MPKIDAFFIALLGALVVYFLTYRDDRIKRFLKNPKKEWNIFLFDLIIYLICGGLVTIFIVEPDTPKIAFIGGCGWQGLVGGILANIEKKAHENKIDELESKLRKISVDTEN